MTPVSGASQAQASSQLAHGGEVEQLSRAEVLSFARVPRNRKRSLLCHDAEERDRFCVLLHGSLSDGPTAACASFADARGKLAGKSLKTLTIQFLQGF